ncbi:mechanosensitive ion channel family protein [Kordiimonas aquimaris]|uniref:mechanosensitive ion channel family protein n=1 Tax=Kordiimonas aquimaris TaxID=707591 RepID=UPI0021CDF3AB|nr:mechanosensitive ion channel domain-containing protein [Kordiimonas aquimaris]
MDEGLILKIESYMIEIWTWFQTNFLEPERLVELAVIAVAILASNIACKWLHQSILRVVGDHPLVQKADRRFLLPALTASISIILIFAARLLLEPVMATYLLNITASLLTAWLVIRLAVGMIANRELARMIAVAAWTFAALNIMGLLDPISTVLGDATLPLGEVEISVLDILTGIVSFAFLMWLAFATSGLLERRIKSVTSMPPSIRELLSKIGKIMLVSIAFLISLNATGIDLTALAVFGGALGVGIGFGLQKVVGNFISGIILLVDRSIKPGDVIETAGTYGTINRLAARYTSVITRDGTEFLIPNEDMITQPVVNWSHSNRLVRRRIPVQVAYTTDIRQAMELMNEAAGDSDRVLKVPEPRTLVKEFGESGVDLELRMWIDDPQNGVSNIASEVMVGIWDKFHEHDIEFPYPTRVVHVKRDNAQTTKGEEPEEIDGF